MSRYTFTSLMMMTWDISVRVSVDSTDRKKIRVHQEAIKVVVGLLLEYDLRWSFVKNIGVDKWKCVRLLILYFYDS